MATLVTKKNVSVNLNTVAADIAKYGVPAVAVFEVIANAFPNVSISTPGQGVISAVIALLTSVLSFEKSKSAGTAAVVK